MSDKQRRQLSSCSRSHNSSVKSYKNISKHTKKNNNLESRTPPLPAKKDSSIEDLLQQRESLRKQLKRISSDQDLSREYSNKKHHTKQKNHSFSANNLDHTLIDSEDEDSIIEQRRKERKQLLEKLKISNEDVCHVEIEKNSLQNKKEDHQTKKQPKTDTDVTDMFSENYEFAFKNDEVTQDNNKDNAKLSDNWDDSEGYYNIKIGDKINNCKYTIKSILGQGVFANVVRAQDNSNNDEVAIKIIRNNELMHKTGLKEIGILKDLKEADPEGKYHCVKFLSNFTHKGHLCLVLESLHIDLRCVLKKYGRNCGINIKALTSYSRQLLLALRLLRKIGIIHADIKPDNILVNEKKNILKLCDFGSATKLKENDLTPYLVSRFYRAPEIILGIPYDNSVDIWSTACTIYEMATGKIMFTGSSNNKMLKCFMDVKGKIPNKIVRKGKFKDQHFNYRNNFLLHKKDEITGREKFIEITNINPIRNIQMELLKSCKNTSEEKKLINLKDLLDKMLNIDPTQRLSATDCLKHPFILEELKS